MLSVTYNFASIAEATVSTKTHGVNILSLKLDGVIMPKTEELKQHYPGLVGNFTHMELIFPRRKPGMYVLTIMNPALAAFADKNEDIRQDPETGAWYLTQRCESNGSRMHVDVLIGEPGHHDIAVMLEPEGGETCQTVRIENNLRYFGAPVRQIQTFTRSRMTLRQAVAAQAGGDTGRAIFRVISF